MDYQGKRICSECKQIVNQASVYLPLWKNSCECGSCMDEKFCDICNKITKRINIFYFNEYSIIPSRKLPKMLQEEIIAHNKYKPGSENFLIAQSEFNHLCK